MDIAALGFSIDSRPLLDATRELDRMAEAADRADHAMQGLAASMPVARPFDFAQGGPFDFAQDKDSSRASLSMAKEIAPLERRAPSDLARAFEASRGGAEAFFAALERGVADLARANTAFDAGTALVAQFDSAVGVLAGTSRRSFGQIASDFALMLARMEMRAAISNIWNLLGGSGPTNQGILGSILGSIFGGTFGRGANAAAVASPLSQQGGINPFTGFLLPGFAGGGDPPVGRPYLVGENGPEIRIDRTPGRILPNGMGPTGTWSAPNLQVNVINNGAALKETGRKTSRTENGWQVDVMVEQIEARMADRLARDTGAIAQVQRARYGNGAPMR